jgi:hypothetical protein
MRSNAKILFFATCYVGAEFKAWWNITQTSRQAFVVPKLVQPTDLAKASAYWIYVEKLMLQHRQSLKAAVAAANTFLGLQFEVVGGNGGENIYLR